MKDALRPLIGLLIQTGVLGGTAEEVLSKVVDAYIADSFDAATGRFYGYVLSNIESPRIITSKDWWFDDEVKWEWQVRLALPTDLEFSFPVGPEAPQILELRCGNSGVKVQYDDVNLSGRFRFGIAMNAINHFLLKTGSPLRLVEVADAGEDFAAYVITEGDGAALRNQLRAFLVPESLTNYQVEVEEKHRPVVLE